MTIASELHGGLDRLGSARSGTQADQREASCAFRRLPQTRERSTQGRGRRIEPAAFETKVHARDDRLRCSLARRGSKKSCAQSEVIRRAAGRQHASRALENRSKQSTSLHHGVHSSATTA